MINVGGQPRENLNPENQGKDDSFLGETPNSDLKITQGDDGIKIEKGIEKKQVPHTTIHWEVRGLPETTGKFPQQGVKDIDLNVESGTLLRDLCAEIKSDKSNPEIQSHSAKLTAKLTEALEKGAVQQLRHPLNDRGELHESMQYAIQWGVFSYFNEYTILNDAVGKQLIKELQQPPHKLSAEEAEYVSFGLKIGIKAIQDELIHTISQNFAETLQSHADELEGLSDQEYKEKILSLQQGIIQKTIAEYLVNNLSEHVVRIRENIKQMCLNPRAAEEIKSAIGKLSEEDLNHLLNKFFANPIRDGRLKLGEMAANIPALTYQRAQIMAEDTGNPALLDDLDQLDKKSAGIVVGRVLRSLADRSGSTAYNFAVSLVRAKYPETQNYISDWRNSPQDDHRYVFSEQGVEKIVEMLAAKGRFMDTPCYVQQNFEDKLVEWLKSSEGDGTIAFVSLSSGHYQPVFAERKEGMLRIFVPNGVSDELMDQIAEMNIPCLIFTEKNEPNRQHDSNSCPVFSLRDISQLSRHPELLDDMEKNISQEDQNIRGSVSVVRLDALPAPMMSSSQSLSFIDSFDSTQKAAVRAERQNKGKVVSRPLIYRPLNQKKINVTITDRRLKYEEVMYSAVIAGIISSREE